MMEIEAKEELATLKNDQETDLIMPPAMNGSHDEIEGAILANDYAQFSKEDFVNLMKELSLQNDFRKAEPILKYAKHHFEVIQDKERSEALKRFIDDGGSPDDFEYRPDSLDNAFDAYYKLLKDRKTEHYRSLEELKNENLKKKNLLLEELRKLVDGEDDRHSFDKFKEIQQQWKVIGQIPLAQIRPLWASYHALMDRYYDNRNIYFELKELDRRKNLEAKLELCQRAERLKEISNIGEAVRDLNELHEDYKHIGPVTREMKEGLWDRFKTASDAVYARRDAFVANLHQELTNNLGLKEQIIVEVGAISAFQSDRIKEWNQKTFDILSLQKKWETVGAVPRAKAKDINKHFWAAFKTFFNHKGLFFKKLDESRVQNLELKKVLVKQADSLKVSKDWDKTANDLKLLQIKWKEIGPVPEKQREKIYQEFKVACDFFFEQRRLHFEESDKLQADNLLKKEAICTELEKMTSEKTGTIGQLREMQQSFQSIGFVSRQMMAPIKSRFSTAMDKFLASLEQVPQDEKDKLVLEIQLETLKTDPDASHKIYLREQALRKRIIKSENDLSILKNNLEFFGRSKNADKMRAEFNEKIDAGTQELVQLKGQLKLLKAAQ